MPNKLYCFSLYCEGHGQTKSQAFATIQGNEQIAREIANSRNKSDFPIEEGWYNHQVSMVAIPEDRIVALAKEYDQL